MKKPRDLDAELEALQRRARALKSRRTVQFGELVIAAGADRLDVEVLAGALLAAGTADTAAQAAWRRAGQRFFQQQGGTADRAAAGGGGPAPDGRGAGPG